MTLPDGTTELITDRPPTTIKPGQQETRDTSRQDSDPMMTTSMPTTSMPTTTPSHLSIIEMLFGLTSDELSNASNTTVNQTQTHEEIIKVVKRQAPQQPPQPLPQQPQVVLLTPQQQQQMQMVQQPMQQSQLLQQAVASNQLRVSLKIIFFFEQRLNFSNIFVV